MDTSHLRQAIAIAVAEARRDAGLTQPQLADFAQRSRSYIAAIEAGSVNVTCETLYALLAVFGRDPRRVLQACGGTATAAPGSFPSRSGEAARGHPGQRRRFLMLMRGRKILG